MNHLGYLRKLRTPLFRQIPETTEGRGKSISYNTREYNRIWYIMVLMR